ncbi:MAG: triose-phosphate isomerase [Bdellovibrionota bacterium]
MASRWVVANWKMNPRTRAEAAALAREVRQGVEELAGGAQVGLAPPACFLYDVGEALRGSSILLGSQNLGWEESGAFTGEVSSAMLRDAGGAFTILGHSERRAHFAENSEIINRRLKHALRSGVQVILCVGETLRQREAGLAFTILDEQLRGALLDLSPGDVKGLTIAYEPVWAIGTGHNATPEQAGEAHARIRAYLKNGFGEAAAPVRILYGGSVNPENAASLFAHLEIDGALVGGASLNARSFTTLVRLAS